MRDSELLRDQYIGISCKLLDVSTPPLGDLSESNTSKLGVDLVIYFFLGVFRALFFLACLLK